jgi:uncharacterized repeat protein (TIGR01451 family)
MRNIFTLLACLFIFANAWSLDPNHFTITRVSAPYFVVDGNSPSTLTKAYVGFEVRNNSNSATTYTGLQFTVTSINTSVVGQNYALVSPATGIINIGTLAPGQSRVCYYYVSYPASTTPQGTFNVRLSDATATGKTQALMIYNRSSISANAGGTATQTISNQDLIGGIVVDDVTYVVGNVQNGDENDFQVAVSSQFDPTKITLLSTQVIASSVPGINAGSTDSLYFISGNGSNGATITMRWTFRITGVNFTTYLLPCAGATSGGTNYKYALNTSLGSGTPITVSSAANPLTISKTSNQPVYGINSPAIFTVTIQNPGAYPVTIDRIVDELPSGFSFQSIDGTSGVTAANSTTVPANGATGTITFEAGVVSGANTSYYIPAGGSIILKYLTTTRSTTASNLVTYVRDYVGSTEVGVASNSVSVSATLPMNLVSWTATRINETVKLQWTSSNEINTSRFELERSNGTDPFVKIGELSTAGISGNNSYSFMDMYPAAGINQYRLRMIDRDEKFTLSKVVSITMDKVSNIGKIYPGIFREELTVDIFLGSDERVHMNLYNVQGGLVAKKDVNINRGNNSIVLDHLGTLSPGTYILKIGWKGKSVQQKLIKSQ